MSELLLRGSSKDALDRDGNSLLVWAAYGGHLPVVEALLAAGVDPNLRGFSGYGDSPLEVAASEGHVPVLKAILGHGVDVNLCGPGGVTALTKAARNRKVDAIHALVEAGANMESNGRSGRTLLHNAAFAHDTAVVLALLKAGAAIEARDLFGNTPLHHACATRRPGLEGTVSLLLRWGADEKASDKRGVVPARSLIGDGPALSFQCSQQEVERTRLLLARAPADRAWRRRCWLVMLRQRAASEATVATSSSKDGSSSSRIGGCGVGGVGVGGVSTSAADDRAGESCKVARTGGSAGGGSAEGHSSPRGRVDNGGGAGVEAGADGGTLSGLVARLFELELEGVFRAVVGFL